ncbi:MAG: archaeal heat shock protein Hsp20 [Methanotrichaceae archaeon]
MWGRRRPSIFDIFDNFWEGFPSGREEGSGEDWFRSQFEDMIRRFEESMPSESNEEGASGTTRRYGPFVYGFSYTAEPGKEPVFQEFGNIRPSNRGIEPSEGREPLVDVMDEKDKYKIFIELPGVDKEKVKLNAADSCVQIRTEDEKKFYKNINLDSEVDPDSAKASYKNGVLTVEINKKKMKGKEINIE